MADIRVTALVSTYRGERFIRGCMEDLVAQTLFARGELEILVIDSASPGNEGEIVAEFVKRDPERVRYVRTAERETLYAAWNRGVQLARGAYLTNANVDDRHDPRCIEVLAAKLDADAGAAAAYVDSDVTEEANVAFAKAVRTRRLAWPDFERDSLFEICYLGPHPMWRKALHEKYGMFDATMRVCGDYEFWLRLASAGERFVHVAEALSLYLENPGSISLANVDLTWRESETARDRYWKAEWGVAPKFRRALPHFERLRGRVMGLPAGTRVGLYGAGKHTQKMIGLFQQMIEPHGVLVGILEDQVGELRTIGGVVVIATDRWMELGAGVIVASSEIYEAAMAEKLRGIVGNKAAVWTVYS